MKAASPIISVIIPAYNAESLIGKTIESVLNQDYTSWEIIIVDDCSNDNTSLAVKKFMETDSRIKYHCVEKNFGGPGGPRNKGVSLAKGKYIAFLDSDDIWHPKKLSTQINAMEEHNSLFCSTAMKDFHDDKEILFCEPGEYFLRKISFSNLKFRNKIPTSSVLVCKSLIQSHPMKEAHEYQGVEDFDCWLKIHKDNSPSIKIDYPFVNYRRVEGQLSSDKTQQIKKVFGLHKNFPSSNMFEPYLYTLSNTIGAVYSRMFKGSL